MQTPPNWIAQNPEKYLKRLQMEMQVIEQAFPFFNFHVDETNQLYVEGPMITRNQNLYTVRAYYPSNYPYSHPTPIVMDKDVVEFCRTKGVHRVHTLGDAPNGGTFLCVMKPEDSIGCGWTPDMSMLTILNLSAAWLHAYEVYRVKETWILPEA